MEKEHIEDNMDIETIIVGFLAWSLGKNSGEQKADTFIVQQQAKENEMLRKMVFELADEVKKLEQEKR